jgi:hypothetical protein
LKSCDETDRDHSTPVARHGAGIWYVFNDPHKRTQVIDALRHVGKFWMVIGWICYGAVEVLAAVRWQFLLCIQKITLIWLRAFAIVRCGSIFRAKVAAELLLFSSTGAGMFLSNPLTASL